MKLQCICCTGIVAVPVCNYLPSQSYFNRAQLRCSLRATSMASSKSHGLLALQNLPRGTVETHLIALYNITNAMLHLINMITNVTGLSMQLLPVQLQLHRRLQEAIPLLRRVLQQVWGGFSLFPVDSSVSLIFLVDWSVLHLETKSDLTARGSDKSGQRLCKALPVVLHR